MEEESTPVNVKQWIVISVILSLNKSWVMITVLFLFSFCLFLGLADWYIPAAGMFLWIKIKGVSDTQELIMKKALEKEVRKMPTGLKYKRRGEREDY